MDVAQVRMQQLKPLSLPSLQGGMLAFGATESKDAFGERIFAIFCDKYLVFKVHVKKMEILLL